MARIAIRYFATLREASGRSHEEVETSAGTLAELYHELRARHLFQLEPNQLKASLNGDWSSLDAPIKDGDTVVFIPPVAGG